MMKPESESEAELVIHSRVYMESFETMAYMYVCVCILYIYIYIYIYNSVICKVFLFFGVPEMELYALVCWSTRNGIVYSCFSEYQKWKEVYCDLQNK